MKLKGFIKINDKDLKKFIEDNKKNLKSKIDIYSVNMLK